MHTMREVCEGNVAVCRNQKALYFNWNISIHTVFSCIVCSPNAPIFTALTMFHCKWNENMQCALWFLCDFRTSIKPQKWSILWFVAQFSNIISKTRYDKLVLGCTHDGNHHHHQYINSLCVIWTKRALNLYVVNGRNRANYDLSYRK